MPTTRTKTYRFSVVNIAGRLSGHVHSGVVLLKSGLGNMKRKAYLLIDITSTLDLRERLNFLSVLTRRYEKEVVVGRLKP